MGGTAPRDGVRVVGINPGPVMTDRLLTLMRSRAQTQFGDAERWTEYMKPLAFGRAAKPEEIAWMAAFLALRPVGLHDRLDRHDRRRRLKPPLGVVKTRGIAGHA
jgi:NAD(P)-dependent dehydrogenase (short-subunit alcohol dehydrogenase family)